MKTTSFLLAALAAAVTGGAFAQTNVTMYGFMDAGIVAESGAAGGSSQKLQSGITGPNRFGFRGVEDLGNGLKAVMNLEGGFSVDTGVALPANTLFGRSTFVGLSGDFGTVRLGNQLHSVLTTLRDIGDPMGNGYAGQAANLMPAGAVGGPNSIAGLGVFRSNTIMYLSPAMGGFSGDLAYSFGEVSGNTSASRSIGMSVGYANGPLTVRFAHLSSNNATDTDTAKSSLLAGNYNFGMAKLYLAYGRNTGFGINDSRELLVGTAIPFGSSRILASAIRRNDRSAVDNDASQFGVAYVYSLSKRTELFASYASISQDVANTSPAFRTINSGAPGVPGGGDKSFSAGVRHFF